MKLTLAARTGRFEGTKIPPAGILAHCRVKVNWQAMAALEEKIYSNSFNLLPEIGSVRFRKILNHFGSFKEAWHAPALELKAAGLEEAVVAKILEARGKLRPEEEFAKLEKKQITVLNFSDSSYPRLLKEIPNPPMVLYVLGNLSDPDECAVAIVGSRKHTTYGQRVAEDLSASLSRAGICVVSGLALGIDACAHRAAVETEGRTVAVLACGLDAIYPASNRALAQEILAKNGAVVSELSLGTPPLKHHFPYRNRIISGLSLGTVVVEAALESGALITARHGLEQNRQVYAVPGSIYSPYSEGPNNLLKMGAKPVTTAADILEDLNLTPMPQQSMEEAEIKADTEEEEKILKVLSADPLHFDAIAKTADLPAALVASTLTVMEIQGKVKNLGGNQYVKSKR